MDPGIYVLVLSGGEKAVTVGSLGTITFPAGWYCYVGSALGPGGLARVVRHIRVAESGVFRPHWHIDHLLKNPAFRLVQVWCAKTEKRLECHLAREIQLQVITGFGSSDCTCPGHLFYSPSEPGETVKTAFARIALVPQTYFC